MLFNSAEFLFVFLPAALVLFFLLARINGAWAISSLGLVSLMFYSWWDIRFLPALLISVVMNFLVGRLICRYRQYSRPILVIGITLNLSALALFKYADFFISTANTLSGSGYALMGMVLPLGISFFTFTQIAFLVDAHRGIASEPSFAKYLLFVTYFPHLIAGPILHHQQMIPQFGNPQIFRLRAESLSVGLSMLTIGMFKKVILADHFAEYANPVFNAGVGVGQLGFAEAWAGALAYSLQLYFDFSGYSDMAIGLSRLFNIDLPTNFNSPYKATNIISFWRRWHISLSTFLRDYLYIPLGGNRHGTMLRYLNLFLTMLLGGLWHGANWTFVVWGALHGAMLAINHGYHALRRRCEWLTLPSPVALCITLLAVVLAWVAFRADTLDTAMNMWQVMLSLPEADNWLQTSASGIRLDRAAYGIVVGLAIVLLLPNTQEFMSKYWRNSNDSTIYSSRITWTPAVVLGITFGVIFSLVVMSFGHVSEFLYFRF